MEKFFKNCIKGFIDVLGLIYILVCFPWSRSRSGGSPRLVWGPVPIISNKYWSAALKQSGFESKTFMSGFYSAIHKKEDFDLYYTDVTGGSQNAIRETLRILFSPYMAFIYAVNHFDIFHHHFSGGFLGATGLWRMEAQLLKLAGCKTVLIAYGSDAYLYSEVMDASLRHGLLLSYPDAGKREGDIADRVRYWTRHADAVIAGMMIDGIGRWDCLPFNSNTIDCVQWKEKNNYSNNDGINGSIKVMHTPNHRGFKGTEFIVQAVEALQAEGLKVELMLVEKMSNDQVRIKMQGEADILAEQIIAPGYAMSALEGMASGLPVLSNLEQEMYTRVFRRYSYLNECPILSTSPETIKDNLRLLVTNPRLREELGRAGRQYVGKYHSQETAQYMFSSIYDKIWYGRKIDLLNLFHPLKSEFNRKKPFVDHPLIENHLAKESLLNESSLKDMWVQN